MPELLRDREQVRQAVNLPAPSTPRMAVEIKRGPTDTIGAVVFPHEVPILREIHGDGNVNPVKDTDPDGRRLLRDALRAKGPVVQREDFPDEDLAADSVVTVKHFDPADDPEEEYHRLAKVYGMHAEQNRSNVEVVYGRFEEGRFAAAVRGATVKGRGKPSPLEIDAMRAPQLQEQLQSLDVEFDPKAGAKELRALLKAAIGV